MADAPATKKDLDALQKNLQKQIDDLRKWAQTEDAARVKDINDTVNKAIKDEGDGRVKDIKALGDWAKQEIKTLGDWTKGELDKLAKAIGSK
jgi:hypothetical protein